MHKNKSLAVISGGGGGIGAACVRALAENGWKPIVLDIDTNRAKQAAEECGGEGFGVDVSDAQALEALARKVEDEIGPVTALAAAAGMIPRPYRALDEPMAHWDRMMEVNLRGVYVTCLAFGRAMLARGAGSIVTIGSLAGMGVLPMNSYGVSKAGVIHLTRALAADWGRRGVRVNCVSPGPVRTPFIEESYKRGERDPTQMERQTALGRLVRPEEVAGAVRFLLSDEASAITGANLPVDAGVDAAVMGNLYGAPADIFP